MDRFFLFWQKVYSINLFCEKFIGINKIVMFKELLDKILPWQSSSRTRFKAKNRLQLVIAHDRAGVNPELLTQMREEILEVVSRYLEIDINEMELSIDSNERVTALTANFPIKRIKRTRSNN